MIWWSILGVLPFTLVLPYANLLWTAVLTVVIGVVLASAFPAIIEFVYRVCAFLPMLGGFAAFLPDVRPARSPAARGVAPLAKA